MPGWLTFVATVFFLALMLVAYGLTHVEPVWAKALGVVLWAVGLVGTIAGSLTLWARTGVFG